MARRVYGWVLACGLAAAAPAAWAQPAPAAQPPVAAAQADAATAEAQAIFREVMSPFCPGLTLADCPSPNAFAMRGDIQRRLANGESRQAIVNELVDTYGAQILADPTGTPIGSIVWGVPIALSALAAVGLAFFLRRATRAGVAEPVETSPESASMRSRVDEELAALD